MLPDDSGEERVPMMESNYAFGYLECERTFVVVGMSFECGPDGFLLRQLRKVQDWMPIGESHWIVVNPDPAALSAVCVRIRETLPVAQVEAVNSTFAQWRASRCPALRIKGVFRDWIPKSSPLAVP